MNTEHPHTSALRLKHRALEEEIADQERSPSADSLDIAALKRKKLSIKDEMSGHTTH
jgi:hypothetical protein